MRVAALIVAAGKGERAGGATPKQFQMLGGKPVLRWSVEALRGVPGGLQSLVIVSNDPERTRAIAPDALIAPGGQTRMESVQAGLAALAGDPPDVVLIHDAARPGLDLLTLDRLLDALTTAPATAPFAPGADSLRRIDPEGRLIDCPPRDALVRVQTPQAFSYAAIVAAYAAWPSGRVAADDLEVAHAFGLPARLVLGSSRLAKITHPEDFAVLESLLAPAPLVPRMGFGVDAHRFGPGDHVTLCGVRIPHDAGLLGHSDADAAWHALTDAILGALGEGDIGDHFPPTDPQWRGVASEVFLQHAGSLVAARGGRIVNVDVTLICERPKIKPHREAMRAETARVLDIPLSAVSVKATTTEEMGFTGRREGIAAQAVASVLCPA